MGPGALGATSRPGWACCPRAPSAAGPGWRRTPPSSRRPRRRCSCADRRRRGRPRAGRGRARRRHVRPRPQRRRERRRPQRSEAPGPALRVERRGTSRPAARAPLRQRSRRRSSPAAQRDCGRPTCFGGSVPYRDEAPAASMRRRNGHQPASDTKRRPTCNISGFVARKCSTRGPDATGRHQVHRHGSELSDQPRGGERAPDKCAGEQELPLCARQRVSRRDRGSLDWPGSATPQERSERAVRVPRGGDADPRETTSAPVDRLEVGARLDRSAASTSRINSPSSKRGRAALLVGKPVQLVDRELAPFPCAAALRTRPARRRRRRDAPTRRSRSRRSRCSRCSPSWRAGSPPCRRRIYQHQYQHRVDGGGRRRADVAKLRRAASRTPRAALPDRGLAFELRASSRRRS